MTIKLKIKEALIVAKGLQELPKLPATITAVKAAYWLGRIQDNIKPAIDEYIKQRDETIKEYGALNDAGNYEIKKDNLDSYKDVDEAALDIEIEIPFERVRLKDIIGTDDNKQVQFSADNMFKIFKILDGEGI